MNYDVDGNLIEVGDLVEVVKIDLYWKWHTELLNFSNGYMFVVSKRTDGDDPLAVRGKDTFWHPGHCLRIVKKNFAEELANG